MAAAAASWLGGDGFTASTSAAELTPPLAELGWWLGAWESPEGVHEHWTGNGGALFGVALDDKGGFEVMIVDDGEPKLRFFAMPNGEVPVVFTERERTAEGILFANDGHDFPKKVRYARAGDALAAEISDDTKSIPFPFRKVADAPRVPELEAAERAFAADTAKRGVDGWVAAFEPTGWMHDGEEKRVGHDAIRATMGDFISKVRIEWVPVSSVVRGDLGFTLGKSVFTRRDNSSSWRGIYVTLWARQADGTWKVRFDAGRTVDEK